MSISGGRARVDRLENGDGEDADFRLQADARALVGPRHRARMARSG